MQAFQRDQLLIKSEQWKEAALEYVRRIYGKRTKAGEKVKIERMLLYPRDRKIKAHGLSIGGS